MNKYDYMQAIGPLRFNRIYVVALIVSLIYLLLGLLFILYIGHLSRSDTVGYINNAVEQSTFAIEEHIKEEFDILMTAAVMLQNEELPANEENVLRELVSGLGAHNAYRLIGFADKNGRALWIDEHGRESRTNLSGEAFFSKTIKGANSLSEISREVIDMHAMHYYSVPVYDGNTSVIKGVLFAADPQNELRRIMNNSLYAGKGVAHIIDSNGYYIVNSDSPLSAGIGDNILEIKNPVSADLQKKILSDLAAGTPGHLTTLINGESRHIAYAPLNINGWHLFYAVPEVMVSAKLKNIITGAILTVSIATCVFILYIFLIRKVNEKNRNALETLAFVDPITGYRNLHKFLLDAKEIINSANGNKYAICYTDIRSFKYINDIYGRNIGDRLLKHYANFLNITSQEGEICCRMGEDTFVSLRRFQSKKEIERRFESASQHIAIFPETFSRGYKVELFGGAYIINGEDGNLTLNDMLDRAIAAQEEVKLAGGTMRFSFYSNEMREKKLWDAALETRMDIALENGEFQVYFQPKIDIQHCKCVIGAEALVRWAYPEKGLLLPERFIGLFEQNGFIVELDRFVFDTACRYYNENVINGSLPRYIQSVNVSHLSLMQPDFIRTYASIKEEYGIPDGCIELEFTESLIFGNLELFKSIVTECKSNGFLCSMDDFGSGYSSLNILKSIHVDVLKLDRQFFIYGNDAERGQKLVKSIITMAKALDMKTVAEGVDDEEQVGQLCAMGCDAIQGFVFARPMPQEAFGEFMKSWSLSIKEMLSEKKMQQSAQ